MTILRYNFNNQVCCANTIYNSPMNACCDGQPYLFLFSFFIFILCYNNNLIIKDTISEATFAAVARFDLVQAVFRQWLCK